MDVLAAGDYHVIAAAGDVQVSVLVYEAHVVSVIPAAAENVFGKLGLIEIALHAARTFDEYLADNAGGAFFVVLVGYHHLSAGNRAADALEVCAVVGKMIFRDQCRNYAAHFGHSV